MAQFRPGAPVAQIAASVNASVQRELALGAKLLAVPPGRELLVATALSRNPQVEFAEPDWMRTLGIPCSSGDCIAPNDAFFGYRWDLHNDGTVNTPTGKTVASTGAVDADIDWLEAFHALGGTFSGSARIGIIDTGVRASHQDLSGKVAAQNDVFDGDADAADDDGHGTHVAGIAAGAGNNAVGVPGVAWGPNVTLAVAKVCGPIPEDADGYGCPSSAIADGIVWAVDEGAHVLNVSLGGDSASSVEQQALQYARSRDVLAFCSAGNSAGSVHYPAALPECVAVSATDWGDSLASYSSYGPEIELSAPGGDRENRNGYSYIVSADRDGDSDYTVRAGTSMASPQAAGLAALLHAIGTTGADAILLRMTSTADDLGPAGRDDRFGAGRINVYAAVSTPAPPPPPEKAATPTISPNGGTFEASVTITLATDTSGGDIHFTLDGSTPDSSATLYTGPFALDSSAVVQAIARKSGFADSDVASATFTITIPPPPPPESAAQPTITPNGGAFPDSVSVALATATEGASIHFTTDGLTDPTETVGILYSGPFVLTSSTQVRARAFRAGMSSSPIASADFTIEHAPPPRVATPQIVPDGGTFSDSVRVRIASDTPDAAIHFTTDGSVPDVGDPLFTAPFLLTASATVTAIAVRGGMEDSDVARADFTITETPPPPPPPPDIQLSVSARNEKKRSVVDLLWTGASGSSVEIYRNGVLHVTTANDGAHSDNLGNRPRGTFTYRVCEPGPSRCSGDASVSF